MIIIHCYQRIILEVLLEIGFIKEMRTTWGNKKVPQTLFHYSAY